MYSIVTGDETWCFQYEPETKRHSSKLQQREEQKPKKTRHEKSKIKSMLICFYDSKQLTRCMQYVGVLKRLVSRIRRIWPEYREEGSWRLFHDNAPSHRSTLKTDYLTKYRIVTINHLSYFVRKFGVHKGLCQIFSAHFKTTRKRPQNSTFNRHH